MAVEREILLDVTKFKARVIGPFTVRQIVSIGITLLIVIPAYFIMKQYFVSDFIAKTLFFVAAIPLACGFIPIYGMPLEKFLFYYIQTSVISPPIRRYKKKTDIEIFCEKNDLLPGSKKPEKVKLSDKEKKAKKKLMDSEFPPLMMKGKIEEESKSKSKSKKKAV